MKRSEVWWVNFEPSGGGEIRKKRPSVIVSNNSANRYQNRIQVVPITSNIERLYPSEAYITVNDKKGKAMADQLTTVSKQRFINRLGEVSSNDMKKIDRAIKTHLDLE